LVVAVLHKNRWIFEQTSKRGSAKVKINQRLEDFLYPEGNGPMRLKIKEHKIEVIPVGVDTERFKPVSTDKEENVLFFLSVLAKFHRYKGLNYLLKALAIVKEEISDVKLIVSGDGELSYYYKRVADSLDLKANVDFTGFVSTEEIVDSVEEMYGEQA